MYTLLYILWMRLKNHGKERRADGPVPLKIFPSRRGQTTTTTASIMEDPSKNPADRLITALKERNITVKRGEIEPALNDATSKAENTKWIAEHLSYDTLLTREELEL